MKPLKRFIEIVIFLIMYLSSSSSILAATEISLDSMNIDEYEQMLADLQNNKKPNAEDEQNKEALTSIIDTITKYHSTKKDYETATKDVKTAQQTIVEFKHKKLELEKKYAKEKKQDLSQLDYNTIADLYQKASATREKTEDLFNEENKKISNLNAISDYSQKKGLEFQDTIDNNKSKLSSAEITELEELDYTTENKYLEFYIQYLQFLNVSHNKLQEMCLARLEYYQYKLAHENEEVDQLNQKLNELSQEASRKAEETLEKETSEFEIAKEDQSSLSDLITKENRKYREAINSATENINIYTTEDNRLSKILETTGKIESDVNSQIDTFAGSLFLSQMLAKQKKSIPAYYADFNVEEAIGNIRIEQYDANSKSGDLESIPEYIEKLQTKYQASWSEGQILTITKLLNQQIKLLARYKEKLNLEVNLLVNLKMKYSQYIKRRQNINDIINKKVFWLQSNQRINISWFKSLPTIIKKELSDVEIYINIDNLLHRLNTHLPKILIALLLSLIIISKKHSIDKALKNCNKNIGSYRFDHHLNSPIALILSLIRNAYYPLFTLILCWVISYCEIKIGVYDIGEIANNARFRLALIVLFASFSTIAFNPGGIFSEHFLIKMPKKVLRLHLLFLFILGILSINCVSKELYPQTFATDVIGEIIFFVLLALMQYILLYYLINIFKNKKSSILEKSFFLVFTIIPAILLIDLILGYFYSVVKVTERLIDTYFIVFSISLIYRIILRSLSIMSRRLAFQRKLEEREQKRKEKARLEAEEINDKKSEVASEQLTETIETDEIMPLSEISNQTISILNISILTISALVLYFVWQDFITVLSYIDSITLWTVTDKDPVTGAAIIKKITMGNLLIAIYSLIMTILFVKNLPGLLEITILNRFTATKNISYSIKTLLTYVILAFGTSFMLSELGITWDELQWLVAALSVGLGFGLQEIFGNFVSGIIILFERPIRLGDIVTIGGTTGIVTKIRIRATTIMDFNKRDLIVPNKTFITSQLTNWSLNEICLTRLIIDVGVSYHENVNEVHNLLLEIANNNKYVMKSPQPYVVFTSFGDSNINFQLRIYINSIKDYDPSIDTLNTEIYNQFKQHGIEIAYNQLEIFVKNTQTGQEIRLNDTPIIETKKNIEAK